MKHSQPLLVAVWLGITSCNSGKSVECTSSAECGGILVCVEAQCLLPSNLGLGGAASFGTNTATVGLGCKDCISAACGLEVTSCETDVDCTDYVQCYAEDCSTSSCRSSCATAYPNGASMFNQLLNCATNSCPSCSNELNNSNSTTSPAAPAGYGGSAYVGSGGVVHYASGGASLYGSGGTFTVLGSGGVKTTNAATGGNRFVAVGTGGVLTSGVAMKGGAPGTGTPGSGSNGSGGRGATGGLPGSISFGATAGIPAVGGLGGAIAYGGRGGSSGMGTGGRVGLGGTSPVTGGIKTSVPMGGSYLTSTVPPTGGVPMGGAN